MLLFDTQQIGNRLLAIRKRLGLTQSEAAELCGLSGRAYADIERGEVNMRIQTVQRICRAFHITPDEILTAENEPLAARPGRAVCPPARLPPKGEGNGACAAGHIFAVAGAGLSAI